MNQDQMKDYQRLLTALTELLDLRLSETYEPDAVTALQLPGRPGPHFFSVESDDEEEVEVFTITFGERAFSEMLDKLDCFSFEKELIDRCHFIEISSCVFSEFSSRGMEFHARCGRRPGADEIVPVIMIKEPDRLPRTPEPEEISELRLLVNGLIAADREGLLEREPLMDEKVKLPTIEVSGDPDQPALKRGVQSFRYEAPMIPAYLPSRLAELTKLIKMKDTWRVGYWCLPVFDEEANQNLRFLVVLSEKRTEILMGEVLPGSALELAGERLFECSRGLNEPGITGLPRSILFDSRWLYLALSPALNQLGVKTELDEENEVLDLLYEEMINHLISGPLAEEERDDDFDEEPEEDLTDEFPAPDYPPAPDDLAGWKQVDKAAIKAMSDFMFTEQRPGSMVFERYFGARDWIENLDDEKLQANTFNSFADWYCYYYRPEKAGRKKPTLAEQLLTRDLPESMRSALAAKLAAVPSIYRVEGLERGKLVHLVDVIFGDDVKLHDISLSETVYLNMLFPLVIYPVGDFNFASIFGPPIPPLLAAEAYQHLLEQGLDLTRPGLRGTAHVFGRLWKWKDEQTFERTLQPADIEGNPLCFHTVVYSVIDQKLAKETVSSFPGVRPGPKTNQFTWFLDPVPGQGRESSLTQGTFTFKKKELVIEIDAEKKYQQARKWLDQAPGLKFKSVTREETPTKNLNAENAGLIFDGEEEKPSVPREVLAEAQARYEEHYMQLLDYSNQAIAEKSLRELAAAGKSQRALAAMIIRSIPTPASSHWIAVPRDRMLRELGLI